MGECFLFSHYRNRVWVTVEGKPVWMDHCLLEPENMSLENIVFLMALPIREPFITMVQRKSRNSFLATGRKIKKSDMGCQAR